MQWTHYGARPTVDYPILNRGVCMPVVVAGHRELRRCERRPAMTAIRAVVGRTAVADARMDRIQDVAGRAPNLTVNEWAGRRHLSALGGWSRRPCFGGDGLVQLAGLLLKLLQRLVNAVDAIRPLRDAGLGHRRTVRGATASVYPELHRGTAGRVRVVAPPFIDSRANGASQSLT